MAALPQAWAPAPKWATAFQCLLGQNTQGYAYIVARDGKVVDCGAVGFARSFSEPFRPSVPWTITSRLSLASVSKPITAVAVMTLYQRKALCLTDPFAKYLSARIKAFGLGVETVTLEHLLTMKSGLVPNATLDGKLWPFLTEYLPQDLIGIPGETSVYSNTNFTILQAVIQEVSQQPYVKFVAENVLKPMGIDPTLFNAIPHVVDDAVLSYSGLYDQRPGQYFDVMPFVAAAGWVGAPEQLIRFLTALRTDKVLTPPNIELMLTRQLGWYKENRRDYYHHNGIFSNDAVPPQQLNTGIIRLTHGYDALLFVNSPCGDVIQILIDAFESA
jgi:CubicO group peptidase (beta-lactamase class C family)